MPIVGQFGSLAGLGSLILPGGAMEPIATVTVGSGGASSIEFTSIGSGWQHLQLRYILRKGSTSASAVLRLNSDTSNTNYAYHHLNGSGSAADAYGAANESPDTPAIALTSMSANIFGAGVIDILDYGSTSKTKTVRMFGGYDNNGGGAVRLVSVLWNSTSAVTTLTLTGRGGGDFAQYSQVALYGLRAP